jgi:DNA helicase II / ATP-dependent DNA helicase PcrA
MWVGTFHGLAHRFLRAHWQDAGLPQHFQILDSDDQLRLVKRVLKALELDESRWPPRQVQGFINKQKDEGLRPEHLDPAHDFYLQKHGRRLPGVRGGPHPRRAPGLRRPAAARPRAAARAPRHPAPLPDRFRHILVDEFQDTNAIQYAWLRLLAGANDNLFAGRRRRPVHLRLARGPGGEHPVLPEDCPGTQFVRLEQNYRSTGNILQAANALIAHNPTRLGKNLWTQDGEGEPIRRYAAFNEVDEARFVVERIRRYTVDEGYRRSECAILYRTTAQSRLFEEALIQAQIPYRVYGGLRFFERAEIRTPSPICASSPTRTTTRPSSGWSTPRPGASASAPWSSCGAGTRGPGLTLAGGPGLHRGRAAWGPGHRGPGAFPGADPRSAADGRGDAPGGPGRRDRRGRGAARLLPQGQGRRGQDRVENLEQLVATAERFQQELADEEADPWGPSWPTRHSRPGRPRRMGWTTRCSS